MSPQARDHAAGPASETTPLLRPAEKAVSWRDLPKKKQLFVIAMARMSEPLVQTSLQSYMFYQLKWFDATLPDSTIARQAGILHASFMAAQFVTAMIWGRVADSSRSGRKMVLLVGLLGTSISCLGSGFSTTFWQALLFRTLGGSLNGNIGVMRTMISEIIREKRFQARAFLILPMTFNVGVIVGPMLGGILSDPAASYPDLFGNVAFFRRFPYAAPNILSSIFLFLAALGVFFFLEETLESLQQSPPDVGIRLGHKISSLVRKLVLREKSQSGYTIVDAEPDASPARAPGRRYTQRLQFRRIFTRNVLLTLFAQFFLVFHIGAFNSLWFVFLSTPVFDPHKSDLEIRLPFRFTGGLGMHPQSVGTAMAIVGIIGITLQLFLYPRMSARLGTLMSWRIFVVLFPFVYFAVPYLSVVPSTSEPPHSKTGPAIWLSICGVLFVQVMARTFALPSQVILVNNCSPHPSVLGTVHGLGQSVSSLARTMGPVIGGVVYGYGLNQGYIGLVFWLLSCVAICACLAGLVVKEGDGHEVWLEGDEDVVETNHRQRPLISNT